MLRLILFLFICIVLTGVTATPASAQSPLNEMMERLQSYVDSFEAELIEARASLETKEDWSVAGIQDYLVKATNYVYYGKMIANCQIPDATEATNDLTSLVELGYLNFWPGNPFNNWEPMKVLGIEAGFQPGEFCLDFCPREHWSMLSTGLGPGSFEMFVYGPEKAFPTPREIILLNTEWGNVPPGAMYNKSWLVVSWADVLAEKAAKEN